MATSAEDWYIIAEESGDSFAYALEGEKQAKHRCVERCNVLNLTKLTVKSLIESSMRAGVTLQDDHPQLQQFLIALEHTFRHRIKPRRSLLGQKRSFWGVIESFEKYSSDFAESVASVRGIPGIRTMAGRGRAWLRFVLMQKKLADHFRVMVENRGILGDWYDPDAVMLSEESTIIAGMLMGLNAIDYNVLMKGEDFDKSVGVLDFVPYLKDGNYLGKLPGDPGMEEEGTESEMSQLLDQKAYLEEMNRKLQSNVEQLQTRTKTLERDNSALTETVSSLQDQLAVLGQEREELRSMNEKSSAELRKALENLQDDQRVELDTFVHTRAGLNDLYSATQKNLETETKLRQQLSQELAIQRGIKEEKETALQLLEKSTHEKQDTIVTLRKQLEELKAANLKMQSQLRSAKETHQKDSMKIRNLEGRLAQLTATSKQTEKEFEETKVTLRESERTSRELGNKLEEVQLARSTAESDLAIEKQWRASLQMEIQREKNRVVELTNETKKLKSLTKEHAELQEKHAVLQETVSEQEITLVEMGRSLSLAQQKVADMKHVSTVMKESVWKDDRHISDCQQCQKPFSVARRKHHCRNCGGIFCFECSENSLQLASSSKPVRVCDSCYSMLLERSNT